MPTDPVTLTTAPPPADSFDLAGIAFHAGAGGGYRPETTVDEPEPGLLEVRVRLAGDRDETVPLTLDWQLPLGAGIVYWQPDWGVRRHMPAEWASRRSISLLRSAPVGALINGTDGNVATWALSETMHRVEVRREGVREESARFRGTVVVQVPPDAAPYEVVLRLDRRPVPYWTALSDTADWWDQLLGTSPWTAPPQGRKATYCTWYSMHQDLTAARIEETTRLAYELGFRTIIVDDGWQTADTSRGYWYCGEWTVEPAKMGDLAAHVRAARAGGMAYLLWLAPSLLGRRSPLQATLGDRTLGSLSARDADILDPRYPEVRAHLTAACLRLLETADLDGFKLDFLDAWLVNDPPPAGPGADVADVETGVALWLRELREHLIEYRPDVLLEFRQNYTGPRMQRYGNLFRAADCPMDLVDNRIRTVDLRLLLPGRTVHSDPLLWDLDAPAEIAAEQLLNALFSVPQVSVDLVALPPAQREMLSFWLRFMDTHADTLLAGRIEATRPDLGYPVVRSLSADGLIAAGYGAVPILLAGSDGPRAILVNATGGDSLVVEVAAGTAAQVRRMSDHAGTPVTPSVTRLLPGLTRLPVPRSGLVELDLEPV
jgi:alpha-galactosidase